MALTNSITWRVRGQRQQRQRRRVDPTTSGAFDHHHGRDPAGATAMNVSSATGWPSATSFYCVLSTAAKEPVGGWVRWRWSPRRVAAPPGPSPA